jgi:hypothetical protein
VLRCVEVFGEVCPDLAGGSPEVPPNWCATGGGGGGGGGVRQQGVLKVVGVLKSVSEWCQKLVRFWTDFVSSFEQKNVTNFGV